MLSHEARGWFAALERPGVSAALEAIFEEAAREIAARGPACWASGRCCNFERAGHRLYVTGLEAAYTVARLRLELGAERERAARGLIVLASTPAAPTLDGPSIDAAEARGGCPLQVANLCGAHAIKPLGCRLYFCERGTEEWQRELHERLLKRVRDLHDECGAPYAYREWRAMLREAIGAPRA